jgi:hypothetical protein
LELVSTKNPFADDSSCHRNARPTAGSSASPIPERAWWRFREALNPDQHGGSPIELPDDAIVRADLAAPHWRLTAHGILLEEKVEIKKRLGRSPDVGDAIVMCWAKRQGALRQQVIKPQFKGMEKPRQTSYLYKNGERPASAWDRHRAAFNRRHQR